MKSLSWRPWWQGLVGAKADPQRIPDALWQEVVQRYPFLGELGALDLQKLKCLCSAFLAHKQFSGAHGLLISDDMALAIAAQACLPVLHLGLHWYDDFRGIVVHPGPMRAKRVVQDDAGVVHHYTEELSGEAMEGGPVALSWPDANTPSPATGYCVVIHEFVHKMDMRHGQANGCPPLHNRALQQRWSSLMQTAFEDFSDRLSLAERFGGPLPWLDSYAATAPAEFFAVAAEAYFVNRRKFRQDFPEISGLFDSFFQP